MLVIVIKNIFTYTELAPEASSVFGLGGGGSWSGKKSNAIIVGFCQLQFSCIDSLRNKTNTG